MIGWYFNRLVQQLEGYQMPVRFLRLVGAKYSFGETSGISNTNTWLNTMDLDKADVDMLKRGFRPGGTLGEASLIQTIYHESTHAYLDLKENEQKFSSFIKDGIAHYRGAPLRGGGSATDPDRIFQEAAASYVGHRAATWYLTYDNLEVYRESVDERTWEGAGNKGYYDRVERAALNIPSDYDRDMRDQVFGYQMKGGEQVETTQAISARIKAFCDTEILEDKIPDVFASSSFLKQRHDSLQKLITQSRTLVPIQVIERR